MKTFLVVGGLMFVGLAAFLFIRKRRNVPGAGLFGASAAGAGQQTGIDPPVQNQSWLDKIRSGPKAAVCGGAAAYYTGGILKPVCGPLVNATNALDASTKQGVQDIWHDVSSGHIGDTAKDVVTAPLKQVSVVWNSIF